MARQARCGVAGRGRGGRGQARQARHGEVRLGLAGKAKEVVTFGDCLFLCLQVRVCTDLTP